LGDGPASPKGRLAALLPSHIAEIRFTDDGADEIYISSGTPSFTFDNFAAKRSGAIKKVDKYMNTYGLSLTVEFARDLAAATSTR